ncbi:MAG: pantoate--beta-alanine ligase [Spirosomataceae bacterium]
MKLFYTGQDVRNATQGQRQQSSVGLVPTMGALHQGHLELVKAARAENDLVVCSIFVNPTQFNNPDDLSAYPRTLEADCRLLESVGCDIVFAPSVEEMYPYPLDLSLNFGTLETVMEGAFRPGHFNGVGIVVSKFFNLIQPHRAYFGQKDLQQTAIIKSLIRNLSYPIELRICPTVRESDGLAMSSRNVRLTPEERSIAPTIYRILNECKTALLEGTPVEVALKNARDAFSQQPAFRLEYIELVDADTLKPLNETGKANALCVAVHLGNVRLIDNIVF